MNLSILNQMPLFRGVLPGELERIFAVLNVTSRKFGKGEFLAMQDEPVNRLIILTSGSIKGEMTDPSGKVIKVEDVFAPNPLAILFLFGNDNRFPVQATARENTEALIIPKPSVLRMLSMNETILKNYLDLSADFASRLSRKLHFMSFRTIRQKVAVYVLELSKKSGSDVVELDRTKAALAEYFGVSRPSLERELSHMQSDGLVMASRKQITILKKGELVNLVSL